MALPIIRNVQIATHSRCNANCVFCPYVESWHHDNPGIMSDSVWQRIVQALSDPLFYHGINSGKICLYLMQEPMLDPRLADRMEELFSIFPNVTIEISTNGAALTPKRSDQLLSVVSKPNRRLDMWISHHGTTAATVREIMQLNPERAQENILHFLRSAAKVLDPQLCTVLLRGGGFDFSRQTLHFTEEDYRSYWNGLLSSQGITLDPSLIVIDYFGYHDRAGTIQRSERGANALKYGIVRQISETQPLSCARLTEWLHFMYDGSLVLCCMDYHREVELPNIMDHSLAEYFSSAQYQELTAIFAGTLSAPDSFICTRCSQPTPTGLGRYRDNPSNF